MGEGLAAKDHKENKGEKDRTEITEIRRRSREVLDTINGIGGRKDGAPLHSLIKKDSFGCSGGL
jgi:hypothetical protein